MNQSSSDLYKYHQLIKGRKYKEAQSFKEQLERKMQLKELSSNKRVHNKIEKEKEKIISRQSKESKNLEYKIKSLIDQKSK